MEFNVFNILLLLQMKIYYQIWYIILNSRLSLEILNFLLFVGIIVDNGLYRTCALAIFRPLGARILLHHCNSNNCRCLQENYF